MRWFVITALLALSGCGHAASSAQARALGAGALWTGNTAVRSIASGQADPEGPEVLWVADERAVTEIGADGGAAEVWRPPKFVRILRLEAMDLDGDGASEWVVTTEGARIRSAVLRRDGGAWVEASAKRPGFLRPVVGTDGSPWLLAQSAGAEQLFTGPIRRLDWTDGALTERETLDLPNNLAVHDIFYVPAADRARLFVFESTGQISERDPRSPRATLWRADARTVSRPVEVERTVGNLLGEDVSETLSLPVPPVVVDLDGDGAHEVLVVAGTLTPVALLDNVRVLQGGDARVMTVGERGLQERNRSPLLGRAMVGVVPVTWDDTVVLAAAVWTRADTGFARPETRVFLLDATTGDLLTDAEPATEPWSESSP